MKTKKILATLMCAVMLVGCMFSFASCGEELNFGKKLVKTNAQVDILTELLAKTSDVGVMDSIMATYYTNTAASY